MKRGWLTPHVNKQRLSHNRAMTEDKEAKVSAWVGGGEKCYFNEGHD